VDVRAETARRNRIFKGRAKNFVLKVGELG